jgi:hypothetical protein
VSDEQMPPEPTEGDRDENEDRILETFARKSSFGVSQFLFEFWPAWMFSSKGHAIAPLCRIVLGNEDDGEVLLDKVVLVTGLLHLAEDLTSAVRFNFQRASELPGFVLDLPGGESHMLEIVGELEGHLKQIREIISENKLFAPGENVEHNH